MIQAIERMNDYYKGNNVDFMHQAITLPGIAKRICLNSITDPNVEIHLFNQKQQDIYQLFKDNIIGGPSIIHHRNQQAQKSSVTTQTNSLNRLWDMMPMLYICTHFLWISLLKFP